MNEENETENVDNEEAPYAGDITYDEFLAAVGADVVGPDPVGASPRSVRNTPLAETPHEYWANTILYRLADAIQPIDPRVEQLVINEDEILEEAVYRIRLTYGIV